MEVVFPFLKAKVAMVRRRRKQLKKLALRSIDWGVKCTECLNSSILLGVLFLVRMMQA